MKQSPVSLLDLLARALAGSLSAESRLFVELRPAIRQGVVCGLLFADVRGARVRRSSADVEDFVQQTCLVLLEDNKATLRNFDPKDGGGNLEAYVCRIATNTTLGILRLKKSGQAEIPTAADEMPDAPYNAADPEVAHVALDLLLRLLKILEPKMSPASRNLFVLHFIDGLDGPQISQLTGMKLDAFWKWASRMRECCVRIIEKLDAPGRKK